MSLRYGNYNGIEVGDTVERIAGHWHGHSVGWTGVVTGLENGHLQFGDGIGHAPSAHRVVQRANPVEDLFERRTQDKLMTNH